MHSDAARARPAISTTLAKQRPNVKDAPVRQPGEVRPAITLAPVVDRVIVRGSVHPGIGVARIGEPDAGFFIGPEMMEPLSQPADVYRDAAGRLRRQAARFRIYGYNAGGQVVSELTAHSADIEWTVHVANRKAQWYQFQAALDIPEAAAMSVPRRNASIQGVDRTTLAIDPGPRSIRGANVSGGSEHAFDTGAFKTVRVLLGEIRTDEAGRLIFLGGVGKSASPSGAPVFSPSDPNSFNNADDWFDDTSDGPVTARVRIEGREVPVEGAWVVTAPPNYAPDIIGWRTLYDLMHDVFIESGAMPPLEAVSFHTDVLPILRRLSNLQWVNAGFAATFGRGRPMDFENPAFVARLAAKPDPATGEDPYKELRRAIFNMFRPPKPTVAEPVAWPHVWPWIYGDAFGSFPANGTGNMLPITPLQSDILNRWADGKFDDTAPPAPARKIEDAPLQAQPDLLDRAALHFCLADTFHPGCEMTWPVRHATIYARPFRFLQRPKGTAEPDYGPQLSPQIALSTDGPLHAQGPGDITRWMALPWQGDTAFCRAGYDFDFDSDLPTFWAARVPNQVLTEDDYKIVVDASLPRAGRLAAYNRRFKWTRAIDSNTVVVADVMMRMIAHFGAMGMVEARKGVENDPDFPPVIYVETLGASVLAAEARAAAGRLPPVGEGDRFQRAGYASEAQYRAFRAVRVRHQD